MQFQNEEIDFIEVDIINIFFEINDPIALFTINSELTEKTMFSIRNRLLHHIKVININIANWYVSNYQMERLILLKRIFEQFPNRENFEVEVFFHIFAIYAIQNKLEMMIADFLTMKSLPKLFEWVTFVEKMKLPLELKQKMYIDEFIQNELEKCKSKNNSHISINDLFDITFHNYLNYPKAIINVFFLIVFKLLPQRGSVIKTLTSLAYKYIK